MKANKVCSICGSSDVSSQFLIPGYLFCRDCKTAWLKVFPKASYSKGYYKGKSTLASWLFSPVSKLLYQLRLIYANKKSMRFWIDVGAGAGEFLEKVPAERRLGVEVSRAGRKIMEEKGLETESSDSFLRKRGLNADVISFWHVLEHVERPWTYLSAAKKNLGRKGIIIIGVPNIESIDFRLFKKRWFHLQPKYHLWHFSKYSLNKLLDKSGFRVNSVDYWSFEHNFPGVFQSFINWSSNSENILHKLVKRSERELKITFKDIFWGLFWLTVGLPAVATFYLIGVLINRGGTMVVVASPKK